MNIIVRQNSGNIYRNGMGMGMDRTWETLVSPFQGRCIKRLILIKYVWSCAFHQTEIKDSYLTSNLQNAKCICRQFFIMQPTSTVRNPWHSDQTLPVYFGVHQIVFIRTNQLALLRVYCQLFQLVVTVVNEFVRWNVVENLNGSNWEHIFLLVYVI